MRIATRQNVSMSPASDSVDLLRSHGLRSTPQRRAILTAFEGGRTEHLSADEVHAQASQTLPDLGRGTVYATLAEFTELGLLAAFGVPEPVRYETNTTPHDHFGCRVCLRLFDLDGVVPGLENLTKRGFAIERVETRAEGICAECTDYETSLREGARAILATKPLGDILETRGIAGAEVSGPLGSLLLAATPQGLIRLAFEEHADASQLRKLAASRRGNDAGRRHLDQATRELQRYLTHKSTRTDCTIDWVALADHHPAVLQSTLEIPYATTRSYTELENNLPAKELGWPLGANPIPIIAPCHRVTRGVQTPDIFVGGPHRREWLLAHEQHHPRSG